MTAPAPLDEALSSLIDAIEDTLARLDPQAVPAPEPVAPVSAPHPFAADHLAPLGYLDPSVDAGALVHALRYALHRAEPG
ncbi:hypothetical protein ACWGR4_18080 [Embleya sp. NPDC055664]|uniref:hypothetical protein n=1 Tax=Embleya sp. NPDC059237 TaxID=3346784 RepID=UPI0036C602E4